MRDGLKQCAVRSDRYGLHDQGVLHLLVIRQCGSFHLRNLFYGISGKIFDTPHNDIHRHSVLQHFILGMQVHGRAGIAAFRRDGDAGIRLALQFLHTADLHVHIGELLLEICSYLLQKLFIIHGFPP